MDENTIATSVLDRCFMIHRRIGPGVFKSIYEEILAFELHRAGLTFQRQVAMPLKYETLSFDLAFRVDLIVEDKVIVELKSIESILGVHKKQLLNYLRLTGLHLGLLVNFNSALLRDGIVRVVNQLPVDSLRSPRP